ncbi:MAG: ABC transporter permease [Bacillota bacterium]
MGTVIFLRKEIREIFRTYKIYILPALFLFFGISSPLFAKFMPQLLKYAGESAPHIRIILTAQPTALDGLQQFLKNAGAGLFAIILIFMGTVLDERTRGTAALVLTKPLSRKAFIWSKFISSVLLVTLAVWLGTMACIYYNLILWPKHPEVSLTIRIAVLIWAFAVFLAALTILASTVSSSSMAAAGGAVFVYVILSILPSLHGWFTTYTPAGLMIKAGKMAAPGAGETLAGSWPALAVTLASALLLVALAEWAFGRQEL